VLGIEPDVDPLSRARFRPPIEQPRQEVPRLTRASASLAERAPGQFLLGGVARLRRCGSAVSVSASEYRRAALDVDLEGSIP
jgi:hypothetical protein